MLDIALPQLAHNGQNFLHVAPGIRLLEARFHSIKCALISTGTQSHFQSTATHQIKESRQAGVTGKGSISVRVSGGCLTDQTAETLPITLWLRTRPDGKFVPLIVGRDLLDAFSEEEKAVLRSEQAACD